MYKREDLKLGVEKLPKQFRKGFYKFRIECLETDRKFFKCIKCEGFLEISKEIDEEKEYYLNKIKELERNK